MSATSQDTPAIEGSSFEPKTVIIRHGIFWYFAKENTVQTNEKTRKLEESEQLVQRIANQNEEVTLVLESDYQRGVQHHAFWTDEELNTARAFRTKEAVHGAVAAAQEPMSVQAPSSAQLAPSKTEGGGDDVREPLDYDLSEFDEESDLIEWVQASGTFDGMRAPNGDEVVKAAGDDPALARRLLTAETQARGDQGPRQGVTKGLTRIIEAE